MNMKKNGKKYTITFQRKCRHITDEEDNEKLNEERERGRGREQQEHINNHEKIILV